jgi:hypothetical protein
MSDALEYSLPSRGLAEFDDFRENGSLELKL